MSQGNNFFGFVIVSTHMRPTVTLSKPKNLNSRSNFLHGINFFRQFSFTYPTSVQRSNCCIAWLGSRLFFEYKSFPRKTHNAKVTDCIDNALKMISFWFLRVVKLKKGSYPRIKSRSALSIRYGCEASLFSRLKFYRVKLNKYHKLKIIFIIINIYSTITF